MMRHTKRSGRHFFVGWNSAVPFIWLDTLRRSESIRTLTAPVAHDASVRPPSEVRRTDTLSNLSLFESTNAQEWPYEYLRTSVGLNCDCQFKRPCLTLSDPNYTTHMHRHSCDDLNWSDFCGPPTPTSFPGNRRTPLQQSPQHQSRATRPEESNSIAVK